jgi:hypothetical protein
MEGASNKPDRDRRLNNLYLAIISRYKEYIEEKESLSVAELPTLVMPNSEKVRERVEEIKSKFLNYTYDNDFQEASLMAFNFVDEEIEDVTLPLQFWITPDETITFMMGDVIDKAILLCSMLVKIGNPSARVFVKIDNTTRRVFVYYEFRNRVWVLENGRESRGYENRNAMLKELEFNDETIAYEFNNQMYADI